MVVRVIIPQIYMKIYSMIRPCICSEIHPTIHQRSRPYMDSTTGPLSPMTAKLIYKSPFISTSKRATEREREILYPSSPFLPAYNNIKSQLVSFSRNLTSKEEEEEEEGREWAWGRSWDWGLGGNPFGKVEVFLEDCIFVCLFLFFLGFLGVTVAVGLCVDE